MEDQNKDVQQETLEEILPEQPQQDTVQQEQEPSDQPVEETQPESQQSQYQDNQYEDNLRNLRQAKEQAEYERDQLVQYFQSLQQQNQPQTQEDDLGIAEDDFVEGKHLGRVTKQVKQMQQELQHWRNYSEEATAELKLNNEFKDFNNVVTADNVRSLVEQYPELRSSIQNNEPLYNRGKATYRLIKKFLGDSAIPAKRMQKAKIQNNVNKPMSSSSIKEQQKSPLSQANMFADGYTEELGQALEDEMYEAIKRYY